MDLFWQANIVYINIIARDGFTWGVGGGVHPPGPE